MSINFCTLSNSSVDSFCGNRRAIVLDRLIDELRPPVTDKKVSNGGWTKQRPPAYFKGINQPRWEQPEAPKYVPTELDTVIVSVTFNGITSTDSQAIDNSRLDLVTVTDIHVNPVSVSVDVNIADMKVTQC